VESAPEIVMRGFAAAGADNGLMTGARNIITQTLEQSTDEEKKDWGLIKEKIRQDLKRYIVKNTQRRPLIMPVILEI
jgi:ribonuclease J